jgi:hypothetical protein
MDRRYTKAGLRDRLEQEIARAVEDLNITLAIRHADSKREHLLQIADALAWSLFQRHEHGDDTYWELIADHVKELWL